MSDTQKEYKKYIKKINTPKKNFNERLVFYKKCFIEYKNWRLKFKFPKTEYLSRIKTIKPVPSKNLLIDLGKSISELREEYINLKGYKQLIIFKLFLFYFAEVFKVIYKSGYLLKRNGTLALEIGFNQYQRVSNILRNYRFREVSRVYDYKSNVRCIISTKVGFF